MKNEPQDGHGMPCPNGWLAFQLNLENFAGKLNHSSRVSCGVFGCGVLGTHKSTAFSGVRMPFVAMASARSVSSAVCTHSLDFDPESAFQLE